MMNSLEKVNVAVHAARADGLSEAEIIASIHASSRLRLEDENKKLQEQNTALEKLNLSLMKDVDDRKKRLAKWLEEEKEALLEPDQCIEGWEWQNVTYRLNTATKEVLDENNSVIGTKNELGGIDFATTEYRKCHVKRVHVSMIRARRIEVANAKMKAMDEIEPELEEEDQCIEEWEYEGVDYQLNMATKKVYDDNNVLVGAKDEYGQLYLATIEARDNHEGARYENYETGYSDEDADYSSEELAE